MFDSIRRVMDNLAYLTVAPYTPAQRDAISDAQETVDAATDEIEFQRDMAQLKSMAAQVLDTLADGGYGPEVYRNLLALPGTTPL